MVRYLLQPFLHLAYCFVLALETTMIGNPCVFGCLLRYILVERRVENLLALVYMLLVLDFESKICRAGGACRDRNKAVVLLVAVLIWFQKHCHNRNTSHVDNIHNVPKLDW